MHKYFLYDRELKMYFYLKKVGFEPTPTSAAAPSNTETTVIPPRPLRFDGKLLNLRRLQAKSKVQTDVVDKLLYADDLAENAKS